MNLEGQQLGEFEILERLGQGGMGAVYKARQRSLGRLVALKTLQASLADDAEYIIRFQQEARAAAVLDHPNLVQVHSAGETDGLHWFAMQYIEGESAKARLKRKGRLDPLEAIAIAIHVATALEYGWRKAQLIHRDIKPDNIFLSSDAEVKLGDLGLAKSAGQTQGLTVTGHSMGTPHYISPEQVQSTRDVDLRADIYSLGCTLYHFLSGQAPFEGNSAVAIMVKHINEPVPILKEAWPECPPVLNEVVGKMMQKDPARRQRDYTAVIADLRHAYEVVSNQDVPAADAMPPQPLPPSVETSKRIADPSHPKSPIGNSKLKTVFYAGIAAFAVTATALVLFHHKGEQLGKETIYTQERGKQQKESAAEPEPAAIRLFDTPEKVSFIAKEGISWRDNALFMNRTTTTLIMPGYNFTQRDSIIRFSLRMNHDAGTAEIDVRDSGIPGAPRVCDLLITPSQWKIELQTANGGPRRTVKTWPFPRHYGEDEWMRVELRSVGEEFTISIDGKAFDTVRDATLLKPGRLDLGSSGNVYLRDIVYVPLDKTEGAQSTASSPSPDTATKDAPFVNSLGMKFVPVPITGGPTSGQRVLFSIWDARVQDYQRFVTDTNREWPKPDFDQSPTHPAVNVSWDDATAFCAWLTEKEHKAGNLPNEQQYRLPTDHEWSCAIGIGAREDPVKLPAEKNARIADVYPWGTDWPPPKGAGNYAGEELRPAISAGKYNNIKEVIAGYNDGFRETSPVGSFAPNQFGLFDMVGNVQQWCQDWFDEDQKRRVLRGATWDNHGPGNLLSSFRTCNRPGNHFYSVGFRCVLELSQK